jgi:hypothetical protein
VKSVQRKTGEKGRKLIRPNVLQKESMEAEKLIPKLTSENYGTWRTQMRLFLAHKDLVEAIEPEWRKPKELKKLSDENLRREKTQQKKASTLIGLKVEDEFLTVIEDAYDSETPARKAWETFEDMFRSVTIGRKMMLQQQVSNLRMQPGGKAAQYIARAKELRRELIRANLDASGVDLAAICGLSSRFGEIRLILEHSSESDPTLDHALLVVMQHESRLEMEKNLEEKTTSAAFYGRDQKSSSSRSISCKVKNPELQCYTCQGRGHRVSQCPSEKEEDEVSGNNSNKRNPRRSNLKCTFCNKREHEAYECRLKIAPERRSRETLPHRLQHSVRVKEGKK